MPNKVDPRYKFGLPQTTVLEKNQLIRFADTKAAWTFSVLGVGTAAFSTFVSRMDLTNLSKTHMILFGIAIILLVISFNKVVRVMYPRFSKPNKTGMIYFQDIISNKKEDYIKKGLNLSEKEILSNLYEQAYDLSTIASKKFKALRYAIISSVITLIYLIILIIII
jgi:hypothetical protein